MAERTHVERSGPGRRDYDGTCILHNPTMENCKRDREEAAEHIDHIETRIEEVLKQLFAKIDGMVTWKVFAFIALLAVAIAGSGFGYFGSSLSKLSDNVVDLKIFTHSLGYRMEQIEKKIQQPAQ